MTKPLHLFIGWAVFTISQAILFVLVLVDRHHTCAHELRAGLVGAATILGLLMVIAQWRRWRLGANRQPRTGD